METLAAIALLAFLLALAVAGVSLAAPYRRALEPSLIDQVDALLPQTQCGKCDYSGCRPYAAAVADGRADINQCPPGGEATIRQLARLLGRQGKPLNPAHGREEPPTVAVIDEELCIGCVKCIRACPVDAIIGAAKMMHTVIPEQCTGCELCIAPCPVDCISMETPESDSPDWVWMKPEAVQPLRP
ncbi:MAG: electron transport complex subunit RsxB [Gammaproteobacteria bacterium]